MSRKIDTRNKLDRKLQSSKYSPFFDRWLWLMDEAYDVLTLEAFTKLEDKIMYEINYHRKKKGP